MSFDILIVQYKSEATEPRCLETLSKFTGPHRLTLYNNNSENRPLTKIWDEFIRKTTSEFVVLANPDIYFGPGWDAKCLTAMRKDPRISACAPSATGNIVSSSQRAQLISPNEITNEWLTKAAEHQAQIERGKFVEDPRINAYVYMLRRSHYLELGGFDSEAFPFYWQETDLNYRIIKAGYRVGCVRDGFVHHVGRVSTAEAEKSGFSSWHHYSSGARIMKQRFPEWGRSAKSMRVLVAIPHLSRGNPVRNRILQSIIKNYQSLPYMVDIILHTNRKLALPGVQIRLTDDLKNPNALPYATRRTVIDRIDQYDLFIYSEDDILITKRNIQAFLRASPILGKGETCGFFRYELSESGSKFYTDAHGGWCWDPKSEKQIGEFVYAKFTNQHQGCFILTNEQMRRVVRSPGFSSTPHTHKTYGFLECAATDPYIQCGLTKYLCISHFNDFLIHHVPNNYVERTGWWGGQHSTPAIQFETESKKIFRNFQQTSFQKTSEAYWSDKMGSYL